MWRENYPSQLRSSYHNGGSKGFVHGKHSSYQNVVARDLCGSIKDIQYMTLCFYIGSLQNSADLAIWKQMQQIFFLERFMWVEEMEVIVKHGHPTCEFTMWNDFVTEPTTPVKSTLPYNIYRGFSWWDWFVVATNKWIVSCEVKFYVDQSETCMIVLCATIYMEHAHICVDLAIWTLFLGRFMWVPWKEWKS